MVATTEELEGLFRPNESLEDTLRQALRADGCGIFERWAISGKVRRMTPKQRAELERQLTAKVESDVQAGKLTLPVSASIVGGILVTGWRDLLDWFMANLPAILEMIMTIIALFGTEVSSLPIIVVVLLSLALLAFSGTASAGDCAGGVCRAPIRAVVERTVHKEVDRTKSVLISREVASVRRVAAKLRVRTWRILPRH